MCRDGRLNRREAGPGKCRLRGHAAGSGRKAATVKILTRDSEESQDEEDNDI